MSIGLWLAIAIQTPSAALLGIRHGQEIFGDEGSRAARPEKFGNRGQKMGEEQK